MSTGGATLCQPVDENRLPAPSTGDEVPSPEKLEVAEILVSMSTSRGRLDPDFGIVLNAPTQSSTEVEVPSPDVLGAAEIIVSMSQGRHDPDFSIAPNAPTRAFTLSDRIAPIESNTTRYPVDCIIRPSNPDAGPHETIEGQVTQADEMAPTTRHQWAEQTASDKRSQSTGRRQSARVQKSVGEKKPAKNRPQAKSPLPAKWTEPAKNTNPAEKKHPTSRSSLLDEPGLVSRSEEIDREIGFPEGPTKENATAWLNKKIGYLVQQREKRNEKSWTQLEAGQKFVADMRKGVLPDSKETPPHLLDGEPPSARTRARVRMNWESRNKTSSAGETEESSTSAGSAGSTFEAESTVKSEPPSDEESAQNNPKKQTTAKKRPRASELETNLGKGWDFKGITSRGRPSKLRD